MGRRGHGSIKHLIKEQLRAVLRVIPKDDLRDRLLINLMYLHGLRRGEAAILTLDCFQDSTIFVRRLKGGISLTYQLFPSSRALLRRYLAERRDDGCPYLFRGRRKSCAPLAGRTIDDIVRRYAAAAGLPADLRHSHVLRHSDLSSTAIYFQITHKRRAKIHRRMLRSREIVRS